MGGGGGYRLVALGPGLTSGYRAAGAGGGIAGLGPLCDVELRGQGYRGSLRRRSCRLGSPRRYSVEEGGLDRFRGRSGGIPGGSRDAVVLLSRCPVVSSPRCSVIPLFRYSVVPSVPRAQRQAFQPEPFWSIKMEYAEDDPSAPGGKARADFAWQRVSQSRRRRREPGTGGNSAP